MRNVRVRDAHALVLSVCFAVTGCAHSSVIALDSAVMAYDRTVVDLASRLLLLNIARAHRDRPMHFTSVTSIAATYDFRFNAGVGPALTGDMGYLPMPFVGGSTAENPTITITPMQGDEFTQRLLTPFDEQKVTMLLRQGYDVDTLLRLMTADVRVLDNDKETVCFNRPFDREGYQTFRRVMAHLSSIQDRHALHVDPLQFRLDPRASANLSADDLKAIHDDPTIAYDQAKQVYRVQSRVTGRVILSNYDHATLSEQERIELNAEAGRYSTSEILVDIRAGYPGGEYPIRGVLRLRSFLNVLTFIGRAVSAEPEFDVQPDPRTPKISENPIHTLEVVSGKRTPQGSELTVELDGQTYALKPQDGYQWNKKAFSVLYQLFQMSVAPAPQTAPLITISK